MLQKSLVTVLYGREHWRCEAVTAHAVVRGGEQCMQRTCGRQREAGRGQGQGAAWVLAEGHPGLAKAGPNPVTIKVKGGLWQWRSQLALAGGSLQLPSAPSIVESLIGNG